MFQSKKLLQPLTVPSQKSHYDTKSEPKTPQPLNITYYKKGT